LPPEIAAIQNRLDELVLRRQRLRELGASTDVLERNRREIVRANQELSLALITAHAPHQTAA
jgi:hypothetical protein